MILFNGGQIKRKPVTADVDYSWQRVQYDDDICRKRGGQRGALVLGVRRREDVSL